FDGVNGGHMQASADGQFAYLPNMIYRQNPISPNNIRAGWVLGSRLTRIRFDKAVRRQAITLDAKGKAVSDPHGLAITPDGQRLVASASGTHELLVFRLPDLPFQDVGGPGDHIEPALLGDAKRFSRIDVGGRPMAVRASRDNQRVFVANYLSDSVQVVDLDQRKVIQEISLGGPAVKSLARRGEEIFLDGQRSLDQWYSCFSCHYEGGSNAQTMDTLNDGSIRTFKTVLPLHGLMDTAPWTWHGWQRDVKSAMRKSLTNTMQGKPPTDDDVEALIAYLQTVSIPPNPYRQPDGALNKAATRGKAVFESDKAACAECHNGPHFTDGDVHDVGTGSSKDVYKGYNTPSLLGAHRKVRWLHHGRAKSLEQLLTKYHNPAEFAGGDPLTQEELRDLIEYVKSL
ncbi:MAG: c-type cytochrome, partial [Planctomycetales bacterium]